MSTSTLASIYAATAPPRTISEARPPIAIVWLVFFVSVTAVLLGNAGNAAGAYIFLGLWVVLGGFYVRASARALTSSGIIWLFPGFALLSALWSQTMGGTLRYGAEFVSTVGCALLAAALLTPRQLISALMCCLLVVAMVSIAFGRTQVDPLSGVASFVGVFAQKNELAFFVSLMLLGSLATMLDKAQPIAFRLLGFLALGVEAPLLVMTRSAASEITAVVAAGVLIANLFVSRLSRFGRARLFFACVMIMLPALALVGLADDGVNYFIVKVMGKDMTLTGRTVLWEHAATLIPSHPMLGVGFQAFWRQNEVEAESLWNQFHILSRTGFHFHNTYVEAVIELGYIGGALLVATVLSVMVGVLRWSWRTGSIPASFFVALMACLLVRSFVEVDMTFPFQIGTFLLFVAARYACSRPLEAGR
jgi:exopolysaccharide production protein ExoQ